jgi:MFS family permease
MTQATETLGAETAPHARIVGAVSAAHFVSHYYIIILAPLMPFVRAEYNVSYTEIGFAFAAFNTVSAVLQTPAGFLVDRLGARALLIGGLVVGAASFIAVGLVPSFWFLVAMFAVAGVANTVYHPADYALLSQHVPARHIGQAFSVHTFAGMLGSAVAPITLLLMQDQWGWRGAFIGAGILGLVAAALLVAIGNGATAVAPAHPPAEKDRGAWQLLLSMPIMMNLVFFILLALTSAGLSNYSVVALGALHGTSPSIANTALTGNLLLSAIGVLIGGLVVARTSRHGLVTALGLAVTAVFIFIVGEVDLGTLALIVAMSLAGLASGVIMPSRDMIVRSVTPPGSFGKVFGFVTTGFNIGGIIAPLIFGPIMDQGSPRLVFLAVAALTLVTICTVLTRPRPAAQWH